MNPIRPPKRLFKPRSRILRTSPHPAAPPPPSNVSVNITRDEDDGEEEESFLPDFDLNIPTTFVTGDYVGVRAYRPDTGQYLGRIESSLGNSLTLCSFQQFGNDCLVHGGYSDISIHDLPSGELVWTFSGHHDAIRSLLALSNVLASCSSDQTVRLWDFDSGIEKECFCNHTDTVTGLSHVDPRGWLVSSSYDHTVRFWDLQQGTAMEDVVTVRAETIYDVLWCGKEYTNLVAAGCRYQTLRLIDVNTFQLAHTLTSETGNFCFHRSEELPHLIFVGGVDGMMSIWDLRKLDSPVCCEQLHPGATVTCVISIGRNHFMSCADSRDSFLRVWDVNLKAHLGRNVMKTPQANHELCCLNSLDCLPRL